MLTTSPYLYIRRPSPTTAEFVVSTRPPTTLALGLAFTAVFLARCLVVAAAGLLLCAKWQRHFLPADDDGVAQGRRNSASRSADTDLLLVFLQTLLASPPGQLATRVATPMPAWALTALCGGLVWVALLPLHTTESLLVLRGLGIQTYSSGPTCLGGRGIIGGGGASFGFISSFGLGRWLWGLGLGSSGSSGSIIGDGGGSISGARTRFIPTEKIRDVLINEAFLGFEVRYCLVVVVEGEEDLVVVFPRLLPRRRIVEAVWRGVRGCLYEPDGQRRLEDKG